MNPKIFGMDGIAVQEEELKRLSASFDGGGGSGYDGGMEARVAKLEDDLTTIKIDVAVIKANGATKSDIAEVRAEIRTSVADAKSAIIMWIVGAVFLAQLVPALVKFIEQRV